MDRTDIAPQAKVRRCHAEIEEVCIYVGRMKYGEQKINRNRCFMNMRGRTWAVWCVVAILLITSGGNAAPQDGREDPFGGPAEPVKPAVEKLSPAAERELKVQQALDKPFKMEFLETPLTAVQEYIETESGIRVQIDHYALRDAGIDRATPITLNLRNISLRNGLKFLLNEQRLTYLVDNGTLLITTQEDGQKNLETKCYPVRDLVTRKDAFGEESTDNDSLVELITGIVRGPSWDTVGGAGTVSAFAGTLIASQTAEIQEEVAQLLAVLRQARENPVAKNVYDSILASGSRIERAAHQRIQAALDRKLDVAFDESPLKEAMDTLDEKTGVLFLIDQRSFREAGIDEASPVTFKQKGIVVRDALKEVLLPLKLTYVIRNEVVLITTLDEASKTMEVRVYPIGDLIHHPDPLADDVKDEAVDLIEVIERSCRPGSWDTVGGPGSIKCFSQPEALILSQSAEVHEEIAKLLSDLRKQDREHPRPDPAKSRNENDKITKVFHLYGTGPNSSLGAENIAEIIKATLGEKVFKQEGVFIRAVKTNPIVTVTKKPDGTETSESKTPLPCTLMVRHSRKVMFDVCRTLKQLKVWKTAESAARDRPFLINPVPVVGQRNSSQPKDVPRNAADDHSILRNSIGRGVPADDCGGGGYGGFDPASGGAMF